jgi:hypothetical protein
MGRFRPGGKARDTDKGEISQISTASTQSATVGRPEGKKVRSHTCTYCSVQQRWSASVVWQMPSISTAAILIVQPHPRTTTCTHLHPWRTGLLGTVPQPMGPHHPPMYSLHPPMHQKPPRKFSYIARHIDFAKGVDSPSPRRPQNHESVFLSVLWDVMPDCCDLPALTKRHRL